MAFLDGIMSDFTKGLGFGAHAVPANSKHDHIDTRIKRGVEGAFPKPDPTFPEPDYGNAFLASPGGGFLANLCNNVAMGFFSSSGSNLGGLDIDDPRTMEDLTNSKDPV